MKLVYTIFFFAITIISQDVIAGENDAIKGNYAFEIESEYLLDSTYSWNPCDKKIVIVDLGGNILREAQTAPDCQEEMPEIIKPLIINCQFLTEIDGSSYYLYN